MQKKGMLKIALILLAVMVILFGITFGILRTMFPAEKIKSIITEQVENVIGRKVEVGKAGISIYPVIGFALSDVAVANTSREGFSKEAFAQFEKFTIQISVASLIKRQPEIRKILISKPTILLEIDSTGSFNFDDLAIMRKDSTKNPNEKKQGMPVLPIPLSLKEFTLSDGNFIFRDARSHQEILVNDIDDRIMFTLNKELTDVKTEGVLSLSKISLKTDVLTKPLTDLTFTLKHDIVADLMAGSVTINSVRLSLQKLFINASGTVVNLNKNPEIDCRITSDTVLLQDILNEIPEELAPIVKKMTAAGKLNFSLWVKGKLNDGDKLPISGTLAVSDGAFKMAELPKAVNQINLKSTFTKNSLDVEALTLKFGDDPVALRLKVNNFVLPEVDLKFLASVNLANVKEFAQLPPGTELRGMVKADVRAKGIADPSDPAKIEVAGKVTLENASVLIQPLVKPALINGTVTLTNKVITKAISLSIGKSQLTLNAEIKNFLTMVFPDSSKVLPRTSLGFTVASPVLDIDEFMPPAKDNGKKVEKTSGKSDALLIAPLPGVDVNGVVTAGHVTYNKIPMNNVKVIVSIINDIADVDIKTGFAGGNINENLHADLRNTRVVEFDNRVAIVDVEVDDLMGNFGFIMSKNSALTRELALVNRSLFGKIRFNSQLSGSGGTAQSLINNLRGNAGFLMADGMIKNSLIGDRVAGAVDKFVSVKDLRFKNMTAALKITDGTVIVEKFIIPSDAGDWNITGNIGFDAGLSLSLSNRLTKNASQQLLDVQNKGKGALKGLLQGSQYAQAAASIVDNTGIPSDNEGRVTALLSLGGTVTDPKVGFTGFGKGSGSASSQKQTPRDQMISKVTTTVDNVKAEAERRLAEERAQAEALVKQKAEEQKQVVEEKKSNVEQQIKKSAASKLKKLF